MPGADLSNGNLNYGSNDYYGNGGQVAGTTPDCISSKSCAQVRSPKLTVAFAQSSYILLTYRVVGASSRGTATVTSAHCSPSS